jgi:hypothetical protein
MAENEPKPLTKDAVDSAPELTIEDVATDEGKALIDARKVLSDAVARTKNDAGAALESEAIKAAALIYQYSRAEWARIRQAFKDQGAPLRELDKEIRKKQFQVLEGGGSLTANREGQLYESINGGFVYRKIISGNLVSIPLTNFTAAIVEDISYDDGQEDQRQEENRHFAIQAVVDKQSYKFSVPATRFACLDWVPINLGPKAIIAAGSGIKDHTRAAIQVLSPEPIIRRVFAHTGWRKVNGVWVFLNNNGALGSISPIEVELEGDLTRYALPQIVDIEAARLGIKWSLHLIGLAPRRVTVPLIASTFLSPLTSFLEPDFTLYIVGKTGSLKTTLMALFLCHYGSDFTRLHPPAEWRSTLNYLEKIAFLCKDVPLLVDDVAPPTSTIEAQDQERKAAALIRAVGNRAGKGRMRPDTNLRSGYSPRCFLWSTGEHLTGGQSTLARILAVELRKGEVDKLALTEAQANADKLAFGMVHYLLVIQKFLNRIPELKQRWAEYRANLIQGASHLRSPEIAAHLAIGFDLFITVAQELGIVTVTEADDRRAEAHQAIIEAVRDHDQRVGGEDPAERFARILTELDAQGSISLQGITGKKECEPVGWEEENSGFLCLLTVASHRVVVQACRQAGIYFHSDSGSLHESLFQKGILVRREAGGKDEDEDSDRGRLTWRKYVPWEDNKRLRVILLHKERFFALAAGESRTESPNGTTGTIGTAS